VPPSPGRPATNRVVANEQAGDTLRRKVENAIERLPGDAETGGGTGANGIVEIGPPDDGGTWTWGATLAVDVYEYDGITLDIARGTKIEYEGDGWVIRLRNSLQGYDRPAKTFAIDGIDAEFRVPNDVDSNPDGFIRATDVPHVTVRCNTRNFRNDAGTATAVDIRNRNHYTEGWKLEGDHGNCDRGVDFTPATDAHDGTGSFVDGRAENLSIGYTDFGVRLRGNHSANVFDSVALFPKADDAVGLVLAGTCSNTSFYGPRWDDTVDEARDTDEEGVDDIAIQTTDEFAAWAPGRPMIYNPHYSEVSTKLDAASDAHDIFVTETNNSDAGIPRLDLKNMTWDSGISIGRDGRLRVESNGTETFGVRPGGVVDVGLDNFVDANDSRIRNLESLFLGVQRSSDPGTGEIDDGEAGLFISDGSTGVAGQAGDLVFATNDGGAVKTLVLGAVSDAN